MTSIRGRSTGNIAVLLVAALALSLVSLVATAGTSRAEPGCTFVAALGLTPGGEGSNSLTVAVDQDLVFWGYLIPHQTVEFTYVFNGEPYGDFTPLTADEEGYVLFVSSFQAGQEGVWTVTASVADTECAATVELTVTPASATAGTPPLLPNTALISPGSAPLGGPASMVILAILLMFCLMLSWRGRSLSSEMLKD